MEEKNNDLTEKEIMMKEIINKALDEKFPDRDKIIKVTRIEPTVPNEVPITIISKRKKKSKILDILRWIDYHMNKIIVITLLVVSIAVMILLMM
jgi:hypothetical protein